MNLRTVSLVGLLGVVAVVLAACGLKPKTEPAPESRPNVIVVLVDDMGFSDIEPYGSEIPTPNLDALANNGLKYSQFYNTARCSTTRASLLTGLYPHAAGMGYLAGAMDDPQSKGTRGRLLPRSVTLAEVLRDSGYYTAMSGKWHLGNKKDSTPWERGFEHSLSAGAGGIHFPGQINKDHFTQSGKNKYQTLHIDGKPVKATDPILGKDWYGTDLYTTWGLKFIDQAIAEEKPFFLYLAHTAPHFPVMAPAAEIDKFKGKYMAGWDKLREARYQRQVDMGLIDKRFPLTPRRDTTPAWSSLSKAEQERYDEMMAVYAAMISSIDQSIGDLVAGLKARNQLDNTLILFMSDNGGNAETGVRGIAKTAAGGRLGDKNSSVFIGQTWATLNNTPFTLFKHFTHEGGIATPLIAHWPNGISKAVQGSIVTNPGHLVDVMPTLLEATGAQYPQRYRNTDIVPFSGASLIPNFKGQTITRGKPIFWEHEGNRAVRDGKWKLVSRLGYSWQLFDMEQDRTEMNDLAATYPDRVREMSAQYDTWAANDYVDLWPETQPRKDSGGKKN